MPSTVNGIGTHYYGKKNLTVRAAVCKSCGRMGNLTSYDTRLFAVVFFIPVIPLGRKRIIDQCPSCTRHYVLKADVYEQTKQLQTSGSLERFRREPSADAALQAHGQLLAFHEHEQAAEFRQTALARFPNHAGLRAGMAAQLRDASSFAESARLFQESFELDPTLPEARAGVAQQKMGAGKLEEAQKLLDFLMEPGAGGRYSLAPLDSLAGYFQTAGRHADAIKIAKILLRELPSLKDHHSFRKFVKQSEKALDQPESILPKRRFSLSGLFRSEGSAYAPWQRKVAIGSVAVLLLAGGLAANNEYIKRHRTLHVLNATGQPAQVQVDTLPAVSVGGMGRLTVSEGPHVVKVSGPVQETYNIALASGYFQRWFGKPVWILNPGGEAVIEDIQHVYSAQTIPGIGNKGSRRLSVGEPFVHRENVDYIFTAAPQELKLKAQEVTKTEINWVQANDNNAFLELAETNHKAALDFAEKRLRRSPGQVDLLQNYAGRVNEDDRGRVEAFLKSGLDRRPVDVPWHRWYQQIAEMNAHEKDLVAAYDKFLAAEPSSGSLIYLRGRIEPDWDKQESYYRRAIEVDPKLGWPWMGIAAKASARGNWDACLNAASKASQLNISERDQLGVLSHEARMAKGEAAALVPQYRAAIAANLQDFQALFYLVDALAASGKASEIDPVLNSWVMRMPMDLQGQLAPQLKALGLYYAGRLTECADYCNANFAVKSAPAHLHALLALGRMKDATDDAVFSAQWNDPLSLLAVSVGFALDGKTEESARWREKAAGAMKKLGGRSDFGQAAELLSAREPPSIKETEQLYLPMEYRGVFWAAVADRFPAKREHYLAEAAKFNICRKPSYYLIERVTKKNKPVQS
jgi:tetratricopeptide (TPR) repeat protein